MGSIKSACFSRFWGIRRKLLTVSSIIVKSMSHVGLTLLFFTDESRDMTRTMARFIVITPPVKTTLSFCHQIASCSGLQLGENARGGRGVCHR
jgi:hypothetical protein